MHDSEKKQTYILNLNTNIPFFIWRIIKTFLGFHYCYISNQDITEDYIQGRAWLLLSVLGGLGDGSGGSLMSLYTVLSTPC